MLEFIQLLKQRYQTVLSQPNNESIKASYQQRIDQLILAEAFIRKGQLINSSPESTTTNRRRRADPSRQKFIGQCTIKQ